jgi:arsenate reductase
MTSRSKATLLAFATLASARPSDSGEAKPANTIVFVCEHGSVKSLIAMQWFNRLAAERGSTVRAISRGMIPDNAVPKGIVLNLGKDGFTVEGFAPSRLSKPDLHLAQRVVSIGVDVTEVTKGSGVKVVEWGDVPPASENYAASRDAIRAKIDALLKELKKDSRK